MAVCGKNSSRSSLKIKMEYKIDTSLMEKGLEEVLKAKVNGLESAIEQGIGTDIEAAIKEYSQARDVARSLGVNTDQYDEYLLGKTKELKQRFGIVVK